MSWNPIDDTRATGGIKAVNVFAKILVAALVVLTNMFQLWGCAPYYGGQPGGMGYGGRYYGGPSAAYAPAPGGGVMAVPIASGPFCKAPAGTLLEIDNDSDYLLEVQSDQVVPLNCDGPRSHVPARVIRRDGVTITTAVIPPHTRAKYVFLALNGGMNNVRVTYAAYMNLGAFAPAPAFKFTQHTYEPTMWPNGVHQDVANGDLRPYPSI